MEKRTGPRIEPWGTPQDIRSEGEDELRIETLKDLPDKYEENQSKPEVESPAH